MTNDEERAVDRIIGEALARYAGAEPVAGIEQRVLQRVHAERGRRLRLWRWVLAAGIAAAAALVLALWPAQAPRIVRRPRVEVARRVDPMPPVAPRTEVRRPRPRHRVWLPFPTPAPISPQERALLALANAPQPLRDTLIEKPEVVVEPIQTKQISIAPLEIEPLK